MLVRWIKGCYIVVWRISLPFISPVLSCFSNCVEVGRWVGIIDPDGVYGTIDVGN